MTTRAQIVELEKWRKNQPDLELDYRFDSFGFWYTAKVNGKYLISGLYYEDKLTPLKAVQKHVNVARQNPDIGFDSIPESPTAVYGPENPKKQGFRHISEIEPEFTGGGT